MSTTRPTQRPPKTAVQTRAQVIRGKIVPASAVFRRPRAAIPANPRGPVPKIPHASDWELTQPKTLIVFAEGTDTNPLRRLSPDQLARIANYLIAKKSDCRTRERGIRNIDHVRVPDNWIFQWTNPETGLVQDVHFNKPHADRKKSPYSIAMCPFASTEGKCVLKSGQVVSGCQSRTNNIQAHLAKQHIGQDIPGTTTMPSARASPAPSAASTSSTQHALAGFANMSLTNNQPPVPSRRVATASVSSVPRVTRSQTKHGAAPN